MVVTATKLLMHADIVTAKQVQLWIPDNFCICTQGIQSNYWKDISHHPIVNCIIFGSNPH